MAQDLNSKPGFIAFDLADGLGMDVEHRGERRYREAGSSNHPGRVVVQLCAHATPNVLAARDRLKMVWPDTGWLSAEVIEHKAGGDPADGLLIRDAVRQLAPAINAHHAVTSRKRPGGNEDPASCHVASVFFTPIPLRKRSSMDAATIRVTADEPDVLARNVSDTGICHRRDRSLLAASALTDAVWIGTHGC